MERARGPGRERGSERRILSEFFFSLRGEGGQGRGPEGGRVWTSTEPKCHSFTWGVWLCVRCRVNGACGWAVRSGKGESAADAARVKGKPDRGDEDEAGRSQTPPGGEVQVLAGQDRR